MQNFCTLRVCFFTAFVSLVSAAATFRGEQSPLAKTFPDQLQNVESEAISWSYTGDTGPLLWTKLNRKDWPLCSTGELQSPININSRMKPSGFKYEWAAPSRACYNLTNNGQILDMTPTCPSIGPRDIVGVQIADDWFNLASIQFHTPSEHRFLDEYYPIEVHFVMKSPNTGKHNISFYFELNFLSH